MLMPCPAIRRGSLPRAAASYACAILACRERRCGRGRRQCAAKSFRAILCRLGFPRRTIEQAAWSMPLSSAPIRRRWSRCRSVAPPSGRPASAKSGGTPSAASRPRADIDLPQQIARREYVALVADDEIGDRNFPLAAAACQIVQTPSSAEVREIIGPAGSDMQILPPTVAVFHILKEARNARQHWLISGEATHSGGQASASSCATVQVADIDKFGLRDGQRRPFQGGEINQPAEMDLRFREQPGPAREPSIACRPNGQLVPRRRMRNRRNGVRSMDRLTLSSQMHVRL